MVHCKYQSSKVCNGTDVYKKTYKVSLREEYYNYYSMAHLKQNTKKMKNSLRGGRPLHCKL